MLLAALPHGTKSTFVHASHPDHSPYMEPVASALTRRATALYAHTPPKPPRCLWVSTVTGGALSDDEATDPEYWARHALSAVDYSAALVTVLAASAQREAADSAAASTGIATTNQRDGMDPRPLYLLEMGEGMLEGFASDLLTSEGGGSELISSQHTFHIWRKGSPCHDPRRREPRDGEVSFKQ